MKGSSNNDSAMRRDLWTKHIEATHPTPPAATRSIRRNANPSRPGAVQPHHHLRFTGPEESITAFQIIRIDPTPKPRMSRSDSWNKRPAVLRYRAFCDAIRLLGAKLPQAYKLTFLIPMPEAWTAAEKAKAAGTPHRRRPDASNLAKATEDALVAEDSVLWRISADKLWSYNPAILIEKVDPTIDEHIRTIALQKTL